MTFSKATVNIPKIAGPGPLDVLNSMLRAHLFSHLKFIMKSSFDLSLFCLWLAAPHTINDCHVTKLEKGQTTY